MQMILSACFMFTIAPALQRPDAAVDPPNARRIIGEVSDFVYSFDDPGFYRLCEFVASSEADALLDAGPGEAAPVEWKPLLERPDYYRGRVVVIEGGLQTSNELEVLNRPGIGRLFQYELSRPGTRAICTVICTGRSEPIRRLAPVRARGIFFKARSFRTGRGEDGAGPLIVARSIEAVGSTTASDAVGAAGSRSWWIIGGTLALMLIWLVVRRATRAATDPGRTVGIGRRSAPPASDADFDWMLEDGDDVEDTASSPSGHA